MDSEGSTDFCHLTSFVYFIFMLFFCATFGYYFANMVLLFFFFSI